MSLSRLTRLSALFGFATLLTAAASLVASPVQGMASDVSASTTTCTQARYLGTTYENRAGVFGADDGFSAKVYSYAMPDGSIDNEVHEPENWLPLTASNQNLDAWGFPPRPAAPAALDTWNAQFHNFHGDASIASPSAGAPCIGSGSIRYAQKFWDYSTPRAGIADIHYSYYAVDSSFILPSVNMSSCPGGLPYEGVSWWVGLEGISGALMQIGVADNNDTGGVPKVFKEWLNYSVTNRQYTVVR